MKNTYKDRLKELFESVVESDLNYNGSFDNIDYYNLFCKAASKEQIYRFMGNDLCMFNCKYDNSDAVMMVFFIPINTKNFGVKNIAEKVIQIVEVIEETFITIDYLKSDEIKEDKFIYVVGIKKYTL